MLDFNTFRDLKVYFCHGANHFSLILMAEKGKGRVYEMPVLYTHSLNNSRFPSALRKKIDLKGKILQGLSSEKIYAFSAKISFASTTKFKLFPLQSPENKLYKSASQRGVILHFRCPNITILRNQLKKCCQKCCQRLLHFYGAG